MIALFTDFGWQGPYVGQLKAQLLRFNATAPIVDLMHDAPSFDPKYSAYLLAALRQDFPPETIFLCVVDPGVGAPSRRACIVRADEQWFVGPDNGLFAILLQDSTSIQSWEILWRPAQLSATFHGRDLFAPVAAKLSLGEMPEVELVSPETRLQTAWPRDLAEIIYQDHYGNCMSGIRAHTLDRQSVLRLNNRLVGFGRTFTEVHQGELFWFENSLGLVEFAVREGKASAAISIGMQIEVMK